MHYALIAVTWALALLPARGLSQTPATSKSTPADLYVGCYLYVRNDEVPKGADGRLPSYAALSCGAAGLADLTYWEGNRPDRHFKFCLPKTAQMDADSLSAMAFAYLDFYDANRYRVTTDDGPSFFILAMIDKWPCPK